MRRFFRELRDAALLCGLLVVFMVGAGVAIGQTTTKADQGKPGNQGPWPVTLSGGGGITIADGGVVTANQGAGNDGGIFWNSREAWKSVLNPVTTAVTCATTATAAPASALAGRISLCLTNNSSVTIYIGGSAVTTSNGFALLPGAAFCDNVLNSTYFCIVASGTADLRALEN